MGFSRLAAATRPPAAPNSSVVECRTAWRFAQSEFCLVHPAKWFGKKKPDHKKTGPLRVRLSQSARAPTITFQRGTTANRRIAIWEDAEPATGSKRGAVCPLRRVGQAKASHASYAKAAARLGFSATSPAETSIR